MSLKTPESIRSLGRITPGHSGETEHVEISRGPFELRLSSATDRGLARSFGRYLVSLSTDRVMRSVYRGEMPAVARRQYAALSWLLGAPVRGSKPPTVVTLGELMSIMRLPVGVAVALGESEAVVRAVVGTDAHVTQAQPLGVVLGVEGSDGAARSVADALAQASGSRLHGRVSPGRYIVQIGDRP